MPHTGIHFIFIITISIHTAIILISAKVQINRYSYTIFKENSELAGIKRTLMHNNMKKIIIMAVLSFAASISILAQNTDLQRWANKAEGGKNLSEATKIPNVVRDAGIYLEKSAKFQYAAIGCAGISAGLAITASLLDTKEYKGDDIIDVSEKIDSDRKLRKGLYIGAGACAVAAICCELASINYKMKAGRSLRLYSTGTGGGLAYTF